MERLPVRGGGQDAQLDRDARHGRHGVRHARVVRDDVALRRLTKERDERGVVDGLSWLRVLLCEGIGADPSLDPARDPDGQGELHQRDVRRHRIGERGRDVREAFVLDRRGRIQRPVRPREVHADGVDAVRASVAERLRQGDDVRRDGALQDDVRVGAQRREEPRELERAILDDAPREADRTGEADGQEGHGVSRGEDRGQGAET